MKIDVEIPKAYRFLFSPARYKVAYGGRGAARSWSFARALLILGMQRPLRVLCAREFQNSIKDSVHKLLADQIQALGLGGLYEVQETVIKGPSGTEFAFKGLRHNVTGIKSHEGADVVWIEEANTVSKASWDVLIPTIRKDGSEIWATFNPELDTDETYQRFVLNAPPNAEVRHTTWRDNPWFPSVLREEMETCRKRSEDDYLTIWEGRTRKTLEGAIYAEELRKADADKRITRVVYNPAKPVDTFWDLGWADHTAIWFVQSFPTEFHVIDYYQDHRKPVSEYLRVLQSKGYVYGTDHLPHDAEHELMAADGRSIRSQLAAAGRKVRIVPQMSVDAGIRATREVFPLCWFDERACADGLQALRRYRWKVSEVNGQYLRAPLHDENSHGADAFRMMGVGLRAPKTKPTTSTRATRGVTQNGWLAA